MTNTISEDYSNKFHCVLVGLKNDLKQENQNNYIELLNNSDIVSSLFKDTAKNILEYSDIYDVDIKFIDDIKILCFLSMNFYKIVEKDTRFTKKYLIFHSMLYRFKKQLPHKDYNNKIIIKLTHMITNLSSYDELIVNNGKFGLFQILKMAYNMQKDCLKLNINSNIANKNIEYSENIFEINEEKIKQNKSDTILVNNKIEEISAKDWDVSDSIQV
jgi:hypothetical protein